MDIAAGMDYLHSLGVLHGEWECIIALTPNSCEALHSKVQWRRTARSTAFFSPKFYPQLLRGPSQQGSVEEDSEMHSFLLSQICKNSIFLRV